MRASSAQSEGCVREDGTVGRYPVISIHAMSATRFARVASIAPSSSGLYSQVEFDILVSDIPWMMPVHDLVVLVDDRPGQLLRVAHVLGSAGVNIEGLSALTGQGRSVIHLLVADYKRALFALAGAQIEARALHEALVLNLADRPNALADCLRPFEQAGLNIRLACLAVGSRSQTRLVVVPDDSGRAHAILAEFGSNEE